MRERVISIKIMKANYLTIIIAVVGSIALFFFPEPETNFVAYASTAVFFVIILMFSLFWKKK